MSYWNLPSLQANRSNLSGVPSPLLGRLLPVTCSSSAEERNTQTKVLR